MATTWCGQVPSAFEEASKGYDSSDVYYSDLASEDSSETMTTQDDGYLIQPKWAGLVGKKCSREFVWYQL